MPTQAWWLLVLRPSGWWAVCEDWYLSLDTAGKGQTPWMQSFMTMVQGPYFFLQRPFTCFQKWRSNVNFHGLFIALPYREKEKKWLKCDFTKYFVFKKLSLCGQKGKRKVTVFIVLSRLSHKEGSVLQIKIVRLLPADKKYEFWGQLQTNPFEQKYIVGVTIFSTCQHSHNKFILLCCGNFQIYCSQRVPEVLALC